MKYYYKKIFILAAILLPFISVAQQSYNVSGVVVNKETNERVVLVAIQILELNRWTTSTMQGEFNFDNVPKGNYTLQASCLSFEKYEYPISVNRDIGNYKIKLVETSLGLDEITVVAKENTSLSSSSKIENIAIDHVQPTNLADVMQLVPGQITLNPDMSGSNQISIRDINSEYNPNDNDAMGTAIIVDGTPLSNDANMQTLKTSAAQSYSTAGQGIDLRQISTDNIESVEVIRGIPSVQYGDLTTGAVLVKTKAGRTLFNAKIKADPRIKQAALSKGFLIPGQNNGALNFDFDYTHSYDDLRKPAESFKRITGQLGYSNTLFKKTKPLSINAKVNYYSTFDNEKSDPDQLKEEIRRDKETGVDLKLYGKWSIERWWLGNITYNFSGSFKQQDYYEYKLNSSNATPIPLAYESGVTEGAILLSNYWSELTIDGNPYNYFFNLKFDTKWKVANVRNKILYGFDWRSSGNNGEGKLYDQLQPPSAAVSVRPRAFKDIPASKKLALFIEDEITIPLGKTELSTQIGVRYTNLLPKGIFSTDDGYTILEPRLNSVYKVLKYNKRRTIRNLSFRFGYGQTSKTPAMLHLYPDKHYDDKLSFNYYPDLIVITTNVIDDTRNYVLKPMTNDKFEIGTDFNIEGVKFILTAFHENIKNGFRSQSQYYTMNYPRWEQLEGVGYAPYFEDGNIYYNEDGVVQQLSYEQISEFESYSSPANNYEVRKKGIEYVVDFGQIESIRTNFRVDGAYYYVNRINDVEPYTEKKNISYLGQKFPFVSVFPGNKGSIAQRLNSNIKTTTHIPALKMILTLSTQLIWIDKDANYWEDENGRSVAYSLGENNEKLYGQFEGVDKIIIDPIGYYDLGMVYHQWKEGDSFVSPYAFMVREEDSDYFDTNSYPLLWQVNMKLTKEFGKSAKLSFFANNLFNHRPLQKNSRTGYYSRRNQSAYFGAELKFSF